jgi:hypothetical protein
MVDWTVERIAALPTEGVKNLRENASRLGEISVLTLCDAELSRRAPNREKATRVTNVTREVRDAKLWSVFTLSAPKRKA